MEASLKIFSAILCFFLVCHQGFASCFELVIALLQVTTNNDSPYAFDCSVISGYSYKCGVSNIKVTTKRTGTTVEGQPQYAVTVTNNCPCAQSRVYLRCIGFSTVQPINPTVLKVKGDSCLLNNGRPITKGKSISFKYSFLQPTDLVPQRSEISC